MNWSEGDFSPGARLRIYLLSDGMGTRQIATCERRFKYSVLGIAHRVQRAVAEVPRDKQPVFAATLSYCPRFDWPSTISVV
jgi:hypothetical protein